MNKKHILSLAAAMLMPLAMMAEGFNFSVSLTDAAGAYLAGKEVSLRLSLLADNPSGTPLYIETQKVSTSPYGVASMVMGEGSKVAGDIAAIDWSGRQVYLKVERMEGANASLVSTTRITAVPYANHAYSAGSLALTSPDGSRWNVAVDNAGQLTAQKETAPYEGPAYGTVDYIFDMKALPTITLEFSLDSWNELLSNFDKNPNNEECVHADFTFDKNGDIHTIKDMGVRLRGNTSRRRPEGELGETHRPDGNFRHVHFGFRFQKYNKDDEHLFSGTDRFSLRWAKEDPTYVHEVYGYDLMRRFGVYTTARSSYCRIMIKIEGDPKPLNYGVYEMFEGYDDQWFDDHFKAGHFTSTEGFMWKGGWGSGQPANFSNPDQGLMGVENITLNPAEDASFTYDLKTKKKKLDKAKAQLSDFITKVNSLEGDAFRAWAEENIDIDLMLCAMACENAIGHWDNISNNGNNFYAYFDLNADGSQGKMKYVPYDLDNTLGTTAGNFDAGTDYPTDGGTSPLTRKILSISDWKAKYVEYLKQLADPANDYIDAKRSAARISTWQNLIRNYVDNDTHEDTVIEDRPASWSLNQNYTVVKQGPNNFFTVKKQAIDKL